MARNRQGICCAVLFGAASAADAPWPACAQQGQVLRHNSQNGIFVDLTTVGAREGCWLSDCTKTDKFVCPSPAECAVACSRVPQCQFWTYEPPITKCFLRSGDGGREEHPDFVSGAKACAPTGDEPAAGGPGGRFPVPFARAALWAAEVPAIKVCDGGIGAPGCDNPYAAMAAWRYAVNNLRLHFNSLSPAELQQNAEAAQYAQSIAAGVADFFRQPTAESFQTAVSNARMVFDALRGFLQGAAPTIIELPAGPGGAPHLPGGRSAKLQGASLATATAQLANGRQMPVVGFGTWQLMGQQAYDATFLALRAGYRHIDTAQGYGNEREVGLAIQHSEVPRDELFIVTKLTDPEDYRRAGESLEAQLQALGTDYLDLYMLHTPGDKAGREAAWRSMEQLHDRGKVRSLGVSNFGPDELQELLVFARIKPVYIQNKLSVYNPGEQQMGPVNILAVAREHGLQVMGYSVINPWPFLLPPMEDPHVVEVAGRYGRKPAQVLHRWALQLGTAVIPKSGTPARIEENAKLLDFELSEPDMRLLNGIVTLSESSLGSPLAPAWVEDVYGVGKPGALG